MKQYFQCRLHRHGLQEGRLERVGWIEERGAKVGAHVQVQPEGDFWVVDEVYKNTSMPEHQLKEHQRLHRGSLPSVKGMQ